MTETPKVTSMGSERDQNMVFPLADSAGIT